jgi:hypothetical protein
MLASHKAKPLCQHDIMRRKKPMAIVNSRYDRRDCETNCSLCGGLLRYPFLCWTGYTKAGGHINLCGPCCRKIKNGFIADLIQITATLEIRELYPNAGTRLVRTTEGQLDREGERGKKWEEAAMLGFWPKAET